ncbi:uncharacterized protein FA14DRAFT_178119 [Meira miltonrushii]|uniref:Secreted protein n=1 Tax=Meira miltonrushii TaxID=1280837 RepID=A0A316VAR1_9BASI|nr:uncharacterized protein FA14DRAFT_178119 [Meira miltonrushii]PWN34719.1 hypothetical protein FA14DRAFT_178119 [Meira miltonrushii]
MTVRLLIIVINLLVAHTLAIPMDRTTGNPSTSGRYDKKGDGRAINRQAFHYIDHAYKQVQELNGHNLQLCSTELAEASQLCSNYSGQHSPKGFHRKSYAQASNTLLHFAREKESSEKTDHSHVCENCKKTMARNVQRRQDSKHAVTASSHNNHPGTGAGSTSHNKP